MFVNLTVHCCPRMRSLFRYRGLPLLLAVVTLLWLFDFFGSDNGEHDIQQRLEEAETIWARGVAKREEAIRVSELSDQNFLGKKDSRIFWDFFNPNFNCPHNVERLGRVGDGGKWICGIQQLVRKGSACVVYSYGINTETSFEAEILDRTSCSLYGYDHTIDVSKIELPKNYPGRVKISKLGLGINNTGLLRTLKSEMDANGHEFIDILKVDIESHEYEVLDQIIADFPQEFPFGQLSIELHVRVFETKKTTLKKFKAWWDKLEAAGLRAFHNEPNLYNQAGKGQLSPLCYEYTFLNVKTDHCILHA